MICVTARALRFGFSVNNVNVAVQQSAVIASAGVLLELPDHARLVRFSVREALL